MTMIQVVASEGDVVPCRHGGGDEEVVVRQMTDGIGACAATHARTMMWTRRRVRTEAGIYCVVPPVLPMHANGPYGNDKEDSQSWHTEYITTVMADGPRKAVLS
jgi:hypothetical protein